jgi:hypothetical protein
MDRKEEPVAFSTFRKLGYATVHVQILNEAHHFASRYLNRHPQNHEFSERLAVTIMDLHDRGIRDPGLLASLAVNREKTLANNIEKAGRRTRRYAQIERRKPRAQKQPENRTA